MLVNPFAILFLLLLVWGTAAFFLLRLRRWAGCVFIGLSIIALAVHIKATSVERHFDEQMGFRVIEAGGYRTLELTNS